MDKKSRRNLRRPLSTVSGRWTPNASRICPWQMVSFCRNGMTGRHGCAGLAHPLRCRYRQAVHSAGRPACGPYGIAMSRWNFVHFAERRACAPYGIAMNRWNFVHFAERRACAPYGIAMNRWIHRTESCCLTSQGPLGSRDGFAFDGPLHRLVRFSRSIDWMTSIIQSLFSIHPEISPALC